jgi:MFS family permease
MSTAAAPNQPDNNNERHGITLLLRALRHRNYRLFFGGQGISLIGSWMQMVAVSWLVYRITNSAFLLGLVAFSSQIPAFLMGPFSGVLVDRHSRYRIILATQTLALLQALILATLVMTNHIAFWHIISLSIFIGIVNSFDIPARQSFVIDMLEDPADLPNAIALNSMLFNSARLIGPTVAGSMIAWKGEGFCFLINAISYIAVIAALLAMRITWPQRTGRKSAAIFAQLREGVKYTFGSAPIRFFLLLLGMMSLVGTPYVTLFPVLARDVLGGGPHTLGFLVSSVGVGALLGALSLASRRSVAGLESFAFAASCIFAIALVAFSFSHTLWISMLLLVIIGFATMVQMAACNTLIQTLVEDDKRGRVMSFYTMAFMGMSPFGALIAGSLAGTPLRLGAPITIFIAGIASCIGALIFYRMMPRLRREMEPILAAKGIAINGFAREDASSSINK